MTDKMINPDYPTCTSSESPGQPVTLDAAGCPVPHKDDPCPKEECAAAIMWRARWKRSQENLSALREDVNTLALEICRMKAQKILDEGMKKQ